MPYFSIGKKYIYKLIVSLFPIALLFTTAEKVNNGIAFFFTVGETVQVDEALFDGLDDLDLEDEDEEDDPDWGPDE